MGHKRNQSRAIICKTCVSYLCTASRIIIIPIPVATTCYYFFWEILKLDAPLPTDSLYYTKHTGLRLPIYYDYYMIQGMLKLTHTDSSTI